MKAFIASVQGSAWCIGTCLLVLCGSAQSARELSKEIEERSRIAAANLQDAIVVDCQLPGKLQKLGGMRTYMTPGVLRRLSAVDCRARGGEYTLGDLSSGTLSLQRWLPLAQNGDAEAQYYVARIYGNGMSGVTTDYAQAAAWYQRASDQNYSSATLELGYLYEQGLGVGKDVMRALDMQRKASGLGEELDYSWKIAAAREDATAQVAALSEQLGAANSELDTLRGKLLDTSNAFFRSREAQTRAESAMLDLRAELQTTREAAGQTQNAAQLAELQNSVAAKELALREAQTQTEDLARQVRAQQAQISQRLTESQASSLELNELLANEKEENRSQAARAAQAQQRLLAAQQELADLRVQYRAEVEQLVAERNEIEQAQAQTKDSVAALLAARTRELERQQLNTVALQRELSVAKSAQANAKADATAGAAVRHEALQASMASLQSRYDAQQRQMQQQRDELASLHAKSQQDRAAVVRDMTEQLAARETQIQTKQARLASLESQTGALRNEVNRLRGQLEAKNAADTHAESSAREQLRMARQKQSEQRERLERMQMEKATEMAGLAAARDELRRQMDMNKARSDQQIAFLKDDLEARRSDLEAKQRDIERLEKRVTEQSRRIDEMLVSTDRPGPDGMIASARSVGTIGVGTKMRSPDSTKNSLGKALLELREQSSGTYHALIIGNSDYRYMSGLDTPRADATDIAELLTSRYGFEVKLLLNATRDQIMTALHEEKLNLTERDSLLIYYAGHGDVAGSPERAFWLGVDADPDTRSGWLEADHIRAKIKEMAAKHVLLVADSCFSGAITHPKTTTIGRVLNETRLRLQWNRRARMVMTSGQLTPVADSVGDRMHSQFAAFFIETLRRNNNVMSGEMLSHEISGRMQSRGVAVDQQGQLQIPTYSDLKDANHDIGDFFFLPEPQPVKVAGLD